MHGACTGYATRVSKVVQVRDVPTDVHAALVHRAHRRGLSLSAYLREVLTQHARTATLDEGLDALPPPNFNISAQDIVDAIHAGREEREGQLIERAIEATGGDPAAFVQSSLRVAAQRVLADRTQFRLTEEAAAEWEAINAGPARSLPGLRRLIARPSPFDE